MSPDLVTFLKLAACVVVGGVCIVELAWLLWDSIAESAPWKAKPLGRKA